MTPPGIPLAVDEADTIETRRTRQLWRTPVTVEITLVALILVTVGSSAIAHVFLAPMLG